MLTDEMRGVLGALPENAFTASGAPKVDAIRDAWAAQYPDADPLEIDADGRDALWEEFQANDAQAGHTVTLTRTPTNPLKLVVNGKVLATIQEGESVTLDDVAYIHFCAVPGIEYQEE